MNTLGFWKKRDERCSLLLMRSFPLSIAFASSHQTLLERRCQLGSTLPKSPNLMNAHDLSPRLGPGGQACLRAMLLAG
jgi:hypothetical protein